MGILKTIAYILVSCTVLIALIRTILLYAKNNHSYTKGKQRLYIAKDKKNIQNIYAKARIHNHGESIDDSIDRISSLSISYQYKPNE